MEWVESNCRHSAKTENIDWRIIIIVNQFKYINIYNTSWIYYIYGTQNDDGRKSPPICREERVYIYTTDFCADAINNFYLKIEI